MYRRRYRGASTPTPNPSLCTDRNLADTRGCFDIVTTGLRECLAAYLIHRLQSVMDASARMIHRLRSTDHITDALVNLHWLRMLQGRSPRVQSASWTRATVSRTTDSRLQLTWLTCTPFGRHETTRHTVCSTVDCRRSSIRRCWPVNLEQSASSCDLSRDSYHVQTETQNISV